MKLDVYSINGSTTGKQVDLDDNIYGVEANDHCVYLAVKQYLANQRQGTHKTKERNEIVGSRKKLKKQKGTGTARFGDIKNPIFRGGGRIFGPKPRDYSFKLNKKVKKIARNSALSYKAKADGIVVLEDFTFDAPKTKSFVEILKSLNLDGKKTLLVLNDLDQNVTMSAKNIKSTKVVNSASLNTYDIMNANTVLISEKAVEAIV